MPLDIDAATGLIKGVRQVLSPHWDARPSGVAPDLIVVHNISLPPGEFGGPWVDRLFTGNLPAEAHPYFATLKGMRVSAHALIGRGGDVVQFVSLHRRAWHAGQSIYQGRTACNDFSVGIELEGTDDAPFEAAQYQSLASLIRAAVVAIPSLSVERVVGHSDIAPGRKTDPGTAFEWPRLMALLA